MTERQNIEWKEIWKDDYLAWICGFANAQGGKLYIGMNQRITKRKSITSFERFNDKSSILSIF